MNWKFRKFLPRFIAALVLLAFLGITGTWWVGSHMGGMHLCVSAELQNAACPDAGGTASAVFHSQAFGRFIAGGAFIAAALLGLGVLLVLVVALLRHRVVMHSAAPVRPQRPRGWLPIIPVDPVIRWLAFLEHSPSLTAGRA